MSMKAVYLRSAVILQFYDATPVSSESRVGATIDALIRA